MVSNPRPRHVHWIALPLAFFGVAGTFVAASAYTLARTARIEGAASDIAANAAPSIQYLTEARRHLDRLELELERLVHEVELGHPADRGEILRERSLMAEQVDRYLALPSFPSEAALWERSAASLEDLDGLVERILVSAEDGDGATARQILQGQFHRAVERTHLALDRNIEFDAEESRELALSIERTRDEFGRAVVALDAANVLLALLAAVLATRSVIGYSRVLEEHGELLARRADELERFSARVAHDVLSPLRTIGLAVDVGTRGEGERSREALERGRLAFQRARRIVEGLFAFAASGARPVQGKVAGVAEVVADVTQGFREEAAGVGIALETDGVASGSVACDPGLLTSALSNLVQNAVRYMGTSVVRRILVRARERDRMIRFEVEDSGPGLPADAPADLFEPYVRGPGSTEHGGIGLGLSTVKRVAEAHGGTVGVRSRPGEGALFWFEVPRVEGGR